MTGILYLTTYNGSRINSQSSDLNDLLQASKLDPFSVRMEKDLEKEFAAAKREAKE